MRRNTLEVRKRVGTLRPCYYGERPPTAAIVPADRNPILANGGDESGVARHRHPPRSAAVFHTRLCPGGSAGRGLGAGVGGGGRAADTVAGPPGGRVLAELPHFDCHAVHNGRILRFPIPPLHDLASAFLRFLHVGCAGPGGLGPQTTSSMSRRWTSVAHGMLGSNSAIPCGRNVTRCSLLPPTPSSLPSGGAREPGGRLEPMPPRLRASGCPGGRRGPGGGSASTRSCCGAAPLGWIFSETALSGPILIVITQTRKANLADAGGGG